MATPTLENHERRISELEERTNGIMQVLESHGDALLAIAADIKTLRHEVSAKLDRIISHLDC